ncbi:MAG: hypothetical protein ACPG80_02550 [Rickettsiales bacterium]
MANTKPPKRLSKEETKAKLRKFLRGGGEFEDVASVISHTLMESATNTAERRDKPKKDD